MPRAYADRIADQAALEMFHAGIFLSAKTFLNAKTFLDCSGDGVGGVLAGRHWPGPDRAGYRSGPGRHASGRGLAASRNSDHAASRNSGDAAGRSYSHGAGRENGNDDHRTGEKEGREKNHPKAGDRKIDR